MISVTEAKKLIQESVEPLPSCSCLLAEAAGLILAKDIISPVDLPPFDQSAMDGFAFCFDSWQREKKLPIKGEIPAGHQNIQDFSADFAIRIFTGAMVPQGADTVIMQEKTDLLDGQLVITDPEIKKGNAIRLKASEISLGSVALTQGSYLSPAALGFIAGMGIHQIEVYPVPKVSIIVTGNELQKPGMDLKIAQVFESNSIALHTALIRIGIRHPDIVFAKDDLKEIKLALEEALNHSDLVILTGGVSVGDYDFVISATRECHVSEIFHGIKQKPGKPLYFGMKGLKPVFGLPGNPASVLTCFYEYVLPALHGLSYSMYDLETCLMPVQNTYNKKTGMAHFLKAFSDGQSVTILEAQESYKMSSFAKANCLLYVPAEITQYNPGDLVEIHRIIY